GSVWSVPAEQRPAGDLVRRYGERCRAAIVRSVDASTDVTGARPSERPARLQGDPGRRLARAALAHEVHGPVQVDLGVVGDLDRVGVVIAGAQELAEAPAPHLVEVRVLAILAPNRSHSVPLPVGSPCMLSPGGARGYIPRSRAPV